jgi:hypothetical protein
MAPPRKCRRISPLPSAAQGSAIQLTSPRIERLTVGLNQNIEGKRLNPAATDSTSPDASRKQRILSIVTSPVGYDFEQAKEPGRTGWTTQFLTNSFQSDLLPGFNLAVTHDLWDSTVGRNDVL